MKVLYKKVRLVILFITGLNVCAGYAQSGTVDSLKPYVNRMPAEQARINPNTSILKTVNGGTTIAMRTVPSGSVETALPLSAEPDIVYIVHVPDPGVYTLETFALPEDKDAGWVRDQQGVIKTFHVHLQVNGRRMTRRILYDAYRGSAQVLGKFDLDRSNEVKMWLPAGMQLAYVEVKRYVPPAIPEAAMHYHPRVTPPASRPRLWVTHESLPLVRSRLQAHEHRQAWQTVQNVAAKPYPFDYNPAREIFYNEELEHVVGIKAFYYLMTGDKKAGKEAVRLMSDYLSVLEFGNVTYGDITREIGRSIYTAALVYDWCYPLIGKADKQALYHHMMRLARDMSVGWPPFLDHIVNGHANEAQINRDLLSMGIALYDEDPSLYRYTSYNILEHLVPMRKFEYQSPRHNQGVDYGAYRFGWEMHAVWLLYRMSGVPVFDDNIKNLPHYWLYMRLPDGYMLRDGDMFSVKKNGTGYGYWKHPQTMLLCYAYSGDALMKAEFERQGGLPENPVLYLLLNDPDLKADHDLTSLPLTKDFGPVLGGMVARTGWNNKPGSGDVIAEIKGGGYNFANHQHADAGALQIYYRGIQVGDLGLYLSYGPPYDFNFNKRSISHSLMLAVDPDETLLFRTRYRDGGSRFNQRYPRTPEEVQHDPWFNYGTVISSDFGPDKLRPAFSYFSADLTAAYTAKMSRYSRGFCFLNLERNDVPAVIILTDDMTVSKPEFKKYWQINTLNTPVQAGSDIVLHHTQDGITGKTHVRMLLPVAADRQTEILSGKEANSTFGNVFEVSSSKPEANGHRIMISPDSQQKRDRFLTVFQMTADQAEPLPVAFTESDGRYQLVIGDRVVSMSEGSTLTSCSFTVRVPGDQSYQAILTGMQSGFWTVTDEVTGVSVNHYVDPGKNTVHFLSKGGNYRISPGREYDADPRH